MRFLQTALVFALSSTVALASVATSDSNSGDIFDPKLNEVRTDISKQLEKRVAPQIARVVIKTWFKIGKAILKDYEAIAEGFDAEGAGFHRDFTDLVEAELPEPPAGFDPNVVPT